jgi:hypothetical protein
MLSVCIYLLVITSHACIFEICKSPIHDKHAYFIIKIIFIMFGEKREVKGSSSI